MFRVTAIYARVSSERQAREGTIESQLEALRAFVAQQGWAVDPDREFVDNGFSGTTLERPALERLRDAIAAGQIQRVVVLSPDRLSRKFVHQEILREEWERAGCQLVYVQGPQGDRPEDRMFAQLQGIFAEYERTVFLERCRRGRIQRARTGQPPYPAPYGYRYLPRQEGQQARWEVVEEEARVVRQLYLWLVEEHLGMRALARRLLEQGVPTPGGGKVWYEGTVHQILRNPAYKGVTYYRRSCRQGGRRKNGHGRWWREEEEWIAIPVPAIVDEELWEMAQEELERHRQLARRRAVPRRYLLQGLVECGECGRRMEGKYDRKSGYCYYVCRGKRMLRTDDRCRSRWVRREKLEEVVWAAVRELILAPRRVAAAYEEQRQLWEAEWKREKERWEREEEALRRQRERLVEAYEKGYLDLEEFGERRRRVEEGLRRLARYRHEWEQQAQEWAALEQSLSSLERFRETIQGTLDSLTFEQKREVVVLLVERVRVEKDRIVIRHILPPSLPALCSPHRKGAGGGGTAMAIIWESALL